MTIDNNIVIDVTKDLEIIIKKNLNKQLIEKTDLKNNFIKDPKLFFKNFLMDDNEINKIIKKIEDLKTGLNNDDIFNEYFKRFIKNQLIPELLETLPYKVINILNTIDLENNNIHQIINKSDSYNFILDKTYEILKNNGKTFNYNFNYCYNNAVKTHQESVDLSKINPKIAQFAINVLYSKENIKKISLDYFINLVKKIDNKEVPKTVISKVFDIANKLGKADYLYNSIPEKFKNEILDKIAIANQVDIKKSYPNEFYLDVLKYINKEAIKKWQFPVDISNISEIMKLDESLLSKIPRGKLTPILLMQIVDKHFCAVNHIIEEKELPFSKKEMEILTKKTNRLVEDNDRFYERI